MSLPVTKVTSRDLLLLSNKSNIAFSGKIKTRMKCENGLGSSTVFRTLFHVTNGSNNTERTGYYEKLQIIIM